MEKSIYEVSDNHKALATIGRAMMDMSEYANCKGMKDEGFVLLNHLSHVGNMLTKLGNTFGPTAKSFTQEDRQLIAQFAQGKIKVPQMQKMVDL